MIRPSASRRAIAFTVKSRRARSSSMLADGSTTISKSCRPGPVERSRRSGANSIPAGASDRTRALSRMQPHADRPSRDDELLDSAVRCERVPQLGAVEPGDDEVGVACLTAEKLVPHDTPDEVDVEPERAHVLPRPPPGDPVSPRPGFPPR